MSKSTYVPLIAIGDQRPDGARRPHTPVGCMHGLTARGRSLLTHQVQGRDHGRPGAYAPGLAFLAGGPF